VQSVTKLAEASVIAPPSTELCLIAGVIIHLSHGKPKRVQRMVTAMREFTDTHRNMASVVRIRGAEYDEEVLKSMSAAALWLERMEPFLVMMARR